MPLGVWARERVRGAPADLIDRPIERLTPNRSEASSIIPRREIRLRAVKVNSAAWGPVTTV